MAKTPQKGGSSTSGYVNKTNRSPYYFDRITIDADGEKYLSDSGMQYGVDSWKLRIGLHIFEIPPISITVTEVNSNMQSAYLLRSKTASKKSPGKKLRQISMSFVFTNLTKSDKRLWGTVGSGEYKKQGYVYENDDLYLGLDYENPLVLDSMSFRGFIAQFQSSPFLPVYNTYLNDVLGIQAVGLVSMQASTVPGLPNTIQVELIMYEFNWKAYVPNAGTFDEVFIKERYVDYFVRSIKKLHDYVTVPFTEEWLAGSETQDEIDELEHDTTLSSSYEQFLTNSYGPAVDISQTNLGTIELFYTDREYASLNWLNSLGDYDQTSYTYDLPTGQSLLSVISNAILNKLMLGFLGVGSSEVITSADIKEALNLLEEGDADDLSEAYVQFSAIVEMMDYYLTYGDRQNAQLLKNDIEEMEELLRDTSYIKTYTDEQIHQIAVYKVLQAQSSLRSPTGNGLGWLNTIIEDPSIKMAMTNSNKVFKGEWELPMKRIGLLNDDLRKAIILETVSITTQNAIVSIPIAGKTSATLQHLGGLGTKVMLQFKVIGEAAVQRLQNVFDAVNGAALSNKNIVVSAVMGIQNELVNLFGVKYVLIDSWQVATIPNYPHTYNVTLSLSDFDIIQQKRETPQTRSGNTKAGESFNINQTWRELKAATDTNSPFTRMKQIIPEYNAYPDLPLPKYEYKLSSLDFSLNESGGVTVGDNPVKLTRSRYYDPDYYFRKVLYDSLQYNEDGTINSQQYQTSEFADDGTIANLATYYAKDKYIGGNEIGSNSSLGTSSSMIGYMDSTFNTASDEDGGKYNIKIDYSNIEIFNQVTEFEIPEEVLTIPEPKVLKYVNGDFEDVTEFATEEYLASQQDLVFLNKSSLPLYQTVENVGTGYYNGNLKFDIEAASDGKVGAIQMSGMMEPIDGDDLDFASKMAMCNMYAQDERENFKEMLIDMKYRDVSGRMIQAFPTYVIYIIDEGGNIHGYKLFDTFYGMQSAISLDILVDKDAPMDTAVVQFSNLSSRLSTAQWFNQSDVSEFIKQWYSSMAAATSRFYGIVTDNNGYIELTPGMRLQVRMGYSSNAENLPVVFNGTISSVELGDVCTVVAAGDGAELNVVTGNNVSGNTTTLEMLGTPMVDGYSVILQCLAANGTKWQELEQRAFAGLNAGETMESTNHFGAILWDTTAFGGDAAWRARQTEFQTKITNRANNFAESLINSSESSEVNGSNSSAMNSIYTALFGGEESLRGIATDVIGNSVDNLLGLKRDYEIYKRNIYPVMNGGYRNYANQADKVLSSPGTSVWALIKQIIGPQSYLGDENTVWYDESGSEALGTDESDWAWGPFAGINGWLMAVQDEWKTRRITLNTSNKTNWQIMQDAASTVPNYILAVRPFEQRSTLFFGKQSWQYTSGVLPLFEPETLDSLSAYTRTSLNALSSGTAGSYITDAPIELGRWKTYSGSGTGIWYLPGEDNWFYYWLNENKTVINLAKLYIKNELGFAADADLVTIANNIVSGDTDSFIGSMSQFTAWLKNSPILNDYLVARASLELEMYKLKAPENPRVIMAHLVNNGIVEHHMPFRMMAPNDTLIPPQISIVEYSDNTTIFNLEKDTANYIYESTDIIDTIYNLYVLWNKSSVDEGGNYTISSDGYNYIKSLLDINNENIQRLITASEDKGLRDITPICKIIITSETVDTDDTDQDIAGKYGIDKAIEAVDLGFLSVQSYTAATIAEVESLTSTADSDALNDMTEAVAAVIGLFTSSSDILLNSTVVGDTNAYMSWDCMQDSIYYGVLGTPENPYKFDRYEGWEKLQNGYVDNPTDEDTITWDNISSLYTSNEITYLTPDERVIRRWQMLTDNPFSKEYGEPVVEVREPFSRWHFASSESNIMANTIKASNINQVYNKINAIAHTTGKNNGKKTQSVLADTSIPAAYIREASVDTGYNYSISNPLDEVNHKNMARYHLKKSLQNMYDGELLMIGSPFIRPYDYIYIFDAPNAMHGTAEVSRVIHSLDIMNGFTTAVALSPIIAIDDSYEFGMITTQWHIQEEKAIRELAVSNILAGYATEDMVNSSVYSTQRKELHQSTLGVINGFVGEVNVVGGQHLITSSIIQDALVANRVLSEEEAAAMEAEEATNEQINENNTSIGQGEIPNYITPQGPIISPIYKWLTSQDKTAEEIKTNEEEEAAAAVLTETTDDDKTYYATNTSALTAAGLLIDSMASGDSILDLFSQYKSDPVSRVAIALGLSNPLSAFSCIWGYSKVREWIVKFAESEPIQVILLNKDGKPLHAGLKGADGIICGKSMTAGWVSDYINIPLPTNMDENVYSELGMSLSDAITFRKARTYAEKLASLEIVEATGTAEAFEISKSNKPFVIEVDITEVIDGDTIKIPGPIRDKVAGKTYSFTNNSVRLWGIDTPEAEKFRYGESTAEIGSAECKAALSRYITNSGGRVKLVINRLVTKDAYGRCLAIVVGSTSSHYNELESWIDEGIEKNTMSLLTVFNESLNMKLYLDFAEQGWVHNLYVGQTSQEGIDIKLYMDRVQDNM